MDDEPPEGTGYHSLYDDEEEDEFGDRDPTLADCIRLWHQAKEWYKSDTLLGIREFAGFTSEENALLRDVWIASVRHVRAVGLIDEDTAYNILWYIVDSYFCAEPFSDDAVLEALSARMTEVERAHGFEVADGFQNVSDLPEEWTALVSAWEARDAERRYDLLRSVGETDLVRLITERAEEFGARMAAVEAKLERDHAEARRRRYGPDWDTWGAGNG